MRRLIVLIVAALLGVGYVNGASPDRMAVDPAKRTVTLIALGDSITAASGACGPRIRCPDHSWATGIHVFSVFQRLRQARKDVDVTAVNLGEPGAGVAYLYAEAEEAVRQRADYVTILIGANDACRWPMMDPATYRAYLDEALGVLREGRPHARVQMVSIPDLVRLWRIAHDNALARAVWRLGECPSLMINPASVAPTDVRRRRLVGQRVDAYNHVSALACKRYGSLCHWDHGWVHSVAFTVDMVALDYFHPNIDGQKVLAQVPLPRAWLGPFSIQK
jgi:lysophospholipase L1-like esterase